MSDILPPAPIDAPFGAYNWVDWYEKVRRAINAADGVIPASQGGTGFSSYTVGDILYANAANTLAKLGLGTPGQILTVNPAGTAPEWDTATGLTNPMTSVGDIIRGGTAGAPTRVAIGTTGDVLTVAGGVPTWAASSGGGGLTIDIDGTDGRIAALEASLATLSNQLDDIRKGYQL